ncbi:MAG: SoxR reducing system RseC family protein [Oscillospiraceae bacterium]|nr:SoxR reducing system RseC family protein [Oscillospiraceae bacterium]
MTQNGVVTKLLERGRAEVAVERGTACGGHCGSCEACIYANRLVVPADNLVYAKPGDRVVLESSTGGIMGAAALIYLMPLVFFFAGYAVGAGLGLAQGGCVAASVAGLVLGGGLAVLLGRRRKEITFRITGYCR